MLYVSGHRKWKVVIKLTGFRAITAMFRKNTKIWITIQDAGIGIISACFSKSLNMWSTTVGGHSRLYGVRFLPISFWTYIFEGDNGVCVIITFDSYVLSWDQFLNPTKMIVRIFRMRKFDFKKAAPQLTLQGNRWKFQVRWSQGGWSRYVSVT